MDEVSFLEGRRCLYDCDGENRLTHSLRNEDCCNSIVELRARRDEERDGDQGWDECRRFGEGRGSEVERDDCRSHRVYAYNRERRRSMRVYSCDMSKIYCRGELKAPPSGRATPDVKTRSRGSPHCEEAVVLGRHQVCPSSHRPIRSTNN